MVASGSVSISVTRCESGNKIGFTMDEGRTTLVVQGYLDELAHARGDVGAWPVITALLGRSALQLELLYNTFLLA